MSFTPSQASFTHYTDILTLARVDILKKQLMSQYRPENAPAPKVLMFYFAMVIMDTHRLV